MVRQSKRKQAQNAEEKAAQDSPEPDKKQHKIEETETTEENDPGVETVTPAILEENDPGVETVIPSSMEPAELAAPAAPPPPHAGPPGLRQPKRTQAKEKLWYNYGHTFELLDKATCHICKHTAKGCFNTCKLGLLHHSFCVKCFGPLNLSHTAQEVIKERSLFPTDCPVCYATCTCESCRSGNSLKLSKSHTRKNMKALEVEPIPLSGENVKLPEGAKMIENGSCHICHYKKEKVYTSCPVGLSHSYCPEHLVTKIGLNPAVLEEEGGLAKFPELCPGCHLTCPCKPCRRKREVYLLGGGGGGHGGGGLGTLAGVAAAAAAAAAAGGGAGAAHFLGGLGLDLTNSALAARGRGRPPKEVSLLREAAKANAEARRGLEQLERRVGGGGAGPPGWAAPAGAFGLGGLGGFLGGGGGGGLGGGGLGGGGMAVWRPVSGDPWTDLALGVAAVPAAEQRRMGALLEARGSDPDQAAMLSTALARMAATWRAANAPAPAPALAKEEEDDDDEEEEGGGGEGGAGEAAAAAAAAAADAPAAAAPAPALRVLEIGCGTGVVARRLAAMPEVSEVKAIDPSLFFINKANEVLKQHLCGPVQQEGGKEGGAAAAAAGAGAGTGAGAGGGGGVHSVVEEDEDGAPLLGPREARKLDFGVGDGRDLGAWPAGRFDAVVLHTTLIHVPNHDIPSVLSEAYRVLAPGGVLSVFENDPAGWNVRHSEYDPLDLALKIMVSRGGRDVNLCQQLPSLLLAAGFQDTATLRKHAVVNTADDSYGMTVIARGIRMLCDQGHVSPALAAALQAEASVRAAGGRFNLSMSYAHCLGTKPPSGPGAPFAASAARTFAAQEAAAAAAAQDAAAAAAAAAVQDVAAQEAGARLAAEAEEAAAAAAERAAAAEAARAAARAEAAEAAAAQAARAAARAAEKAREGAAAALLPAAPAVATRGGGAGKESESTGSANSFTARDDPKQKGRRTRSGDSQKLAAKKKDTKKAGGDDDVPSEV